MYTFFLFCAVVAGAVFAVQFVLSIVGFAGEGLDLPDDLPDSIGHAADGTFADHGSTWLFGALSLRTVVAGILFFGLGGLTAHSANLGDFVSLGVAIVAGLGALYGVHFLMRSLFRLGHDGTVRTRNAVGKTATVYLPIPADHSGKGKVQVRMQGRLVELAAMTKASEKLRSGTAVRVIGVIADSTVEVEPIHELEPKSPDTVVA